MKKADEQRLEETRRSWDHATRVHNAHKKDQAAFFRDGGDTLYPEELELLGGVDGLSGRRVLHAQCNAGQDTLSLARHGARVVGVDLSGEAVSFARTLSRESGIDALFYEDEVVHFLEGQEERAPFDVVFQSYGAVVWLEDLPRFFRGVAARLLPKGRYVLLEFHPLAWSFDAQFRLKDPYFAPGRVFSEPVGDYVGEALGSLSPSGHTALDPGLAGANPHPAHSYQHTVADLVTAVLDAGLALTGLREYPYSNGCRIHPGLVPVDDERFTTPPGVPSLPLMLGLVATAK